MPNLKHLSERVALFMILSLLVTMFSFTADTTSARAAIAYSDTSEYEKLAELYSDYFKVGAVCGSVLNNTDKEAAVINLFNSITCENEMKPDANFNSSADGLFKINRNAENLLAWAKANGVQMRGHCLVWHSQVNPKIFAKDFKPTVKGKTTTSYTDYLDEECLVDRDTLCERLKTYIYSMMEYIYSNGYADVVYAWDVVNEAIDESNTDSLRKSSWYRILGPDFLYYSFLYAREATVYYANEYASLYGLDPAVDSLDSILPDLFYNDYNEWFPKRVDAIIKYMTEYKYNENQSMVQSDVIKADGDGTILGDGLIDGIGMQGHLSVDNEIKPYIRALKKYSDAVGQVQITELDIGCSGTEETKYNKQAKFFYDLFTALIEAENDGANITCVTLWGLTDDASWRSQDSPLLLFKDLSKKPAYNAVVMAALGEEYSVESVEVKAELKDLIIDFEPYQVNGSTVTVDPSSVGIKSRGTGHQATLVLKSRINHTEGVSKGYSLICNRQEKDANLKIDISQFCGQNITVKLFVKTKDKTVYCGLDGSDPVVLASVTAGDDEWHEITFNTDIAEGDSASLFVETDSNDDFYLDDISIVFTKEGEQKPEITSTVATENTASEDSSKPADTVTENNVQPADDNATETVVANDDQQSSSSVETPADNNSKTGTVVAIVLAVVAVILVNIAIRRKK